MPSSLTHADPRCAPRLRRLGSGASRGHATAPAPTPAASVCPASTRPCGRTGRRRPRARRPNLGLLVRGVTVESLRQLLLLLLLPLDSSSYGRPASGSSSARAVSSVAPQLVIEIGSRNEGTRDAPVGRLAQARAAALAHRPRRQADRACAAQRGHLVLVAAAAVV